MIKAHINSQRLSLHAQGLHGWAPRPSLYVSWLPPQCFPKIVEDGQEAGSDFCASLGLFSFCLSLVPFLYDSFCVILLYFNLLYFLIFPQKTERRGSQWEGRGAHVFLIDEHSTLCHLKNSSDVCTWCHMGGY